jgi:hypothetical protein
MVSDAPKLKRKKRDKQALIKKGFALVSMMAFLGVFGGAAIIRVYMEAFNPEPQPSAEATYTEQANSLVEMEQGYLIVLEREPENQPALEGLVQTRLNMGKLEEAVSPLETLVNLYPDRDDYQLLLTRLQEDTASRQ